MFWINFYYRTRYIFLQTEPIRLGPQQYACPVCSRIMRSRAEVIRHIRIHTGEKPFNCNLCNFKTNQKTILTTHINRTHQYHWILFLCMSFFENKRNDIFFCRMSQLDLVHVNLLVHIVLKLWKWNVTCNDTYELILEKNLFIVFIVTMIFLENVV